MAYLHCHACGWDNGDFLYDDNGSKSYWAQSLGEKRFGKLNKAQIYKSEKDFEVKNPKRLCPKCGKSELDID